MIGTALDYSQRFARARLIDFEDFRKVVTQAHVFARCKGLGCQGERLQPIESKGAIVIAQLTPRQKHPISMQPDDAQRPNRPFTASPGFVDISRMQFAVLLAAHSDAAVSFARSLIFEQNRNPIRVTDLPDVAVAATARREFSHRPSGLLWQAQGR